ncbi:MAG: glutaredoxin family protein [Candidatus Thermoplasmatota archaeon]|nr:glutaredoxin family protein [Candidatus Thermoplasmatota archaeon]
MTENCSRHKVFIYALSTCGWCKKTKELLKGLGVEFDFVDVDRLSGDEREKARNELKKHNPRGSFPTIVIDDGAKVIIGFQEEEVKEVLSG